MATLSEKQIANIREHMIHQQDALDILYKSKKKTFDSVGVPFSNVDLYEKMEWIRERDLKTKVIMTRKKSHDRQFEDDIWCMFYALGFKILNGDENLRVQWGNNDGEDKQLDIVAVGDNEIFVVECKSAKQSKRQSFQQDLIEIAHYQNGIGESLRQIYGADKRVKFIFATRNFRIDSEGDDYERMKNYGIYHLDDSGYSYVSNLIKSYRETAIYQFLAMMFKDELISDKPITIPALKGHMGDKSYYLFSIEPSTLLKIGFVLHRTKVNDFMANPTYQRLLVPNRLKGITKFIDGGGYFPNSIILNFSEKNESTKITFDSIHKEADSDSEFGLLSIPNAYAIAYIIDGQHRVYGYANSKYKKHHTIPVVAFQNMAPEEQLKIFMEINENQKAVSKNLRIDLEEDLFWRSERLDSRMKALRSSVIKVLGSMSSNILYNKISLSESQPGLNSLNLNQGLLKSGLIPRGKNTKWEGDTDTCLYDVNETDISKAMEEAKKKIVTFLNGCYDIADASMEEETKKDFLFSNRASYAFVALMGLLNTFLFRCGVIEHSSSVKDRLEKMRPYIIALCDGFNNISDEDYSSLKESLGQGAEKKWLLAYQGMVNKVFPDYNPEELQEWREMRDKNLQTEGEEMKQSIYEAFKSLVFLKVKEEYGENADRHLAKLRHECESKIYNLYPDEIDISNYDWKDFVELADLRDIVDRNFVHDRFAQAFGIPLTNTATSKKDKMSWINKIVFQKKKGKVTITRSDLNCLWMIYNHLNNLLPQENV